MPTGYTHKVGDGEISDFPTFAMLCARAFGICIRMRDDPMDAPIPERFEPSDYHKKAITEAEEKLEKLRGWGEMEFRVAAGNDYAEKMKRHQEYKTETEDQNARFQAMLDLVTAWESPSDEHQDFKKFMADQLEISISSYSPAAPAKLLWNEWRQAEIDQAEKDLAYRHAEYAKELKGVKNGNDWLRLLRESLA